MLILTTSCGFQNWMMLFASYLLLGLAISLYAVIPSVLEKLCVKLCSL